MRTLTLLEGLEGSGKTRYLEQEKEKTPVISSTIFGKLHGLGSARIRESHIKHKKIADCLRDSDSINVIDYVMTRFRAIYSSFWRLIDDLDEHQHVYIERSPAAILHYENILEQSDWVKTRELIQTIKHDIRVKLLERGITVEVLYFASMTYLDREYYKICQELFPKVNFLYWGFKLKYYNIDGKEVRDLEEENKCYIIKERTLEDMSEQYAKLNEGQNE
ncbi:MAG: hypothetical protein ACRCST_13490 [Turicibacter sp.]